MSEFDSLAAGSRRTGSACGRWPTGCSARSPRRTTPSRRPGCGSPGRTPTASRTSSAWLTTIVVRVCLNMLRSRQEAARGALGACTCPTRSSAARTVWPRGRGAAGRLGRTRAAGGARHAGSRRATGVRPARHVRPALRRDRPHGGAYPGHGEAARQPGAAPGAGAGRPAPDPDIGRQREVVDAFFAAARQGELRRAGRGPRPRRRAAVRRRGGPPGASAVVRGAAAVAGRAVMFDRPAALVRPALVNGAAGVVMTVDGRPVVGHGVHGLGRPDRADRRDGRPRAPRPAGPGRSRLDLPVTLERIRGVFL